MAQYQRKVGNLLIDTRFQLKYTAFVLVISLSIFAVLGWFYLKERRTASELMEVNRIVQKASAGQDAAGVPDMGAELEAAMAAADQANADALNQQVSRSNEERDMQAFYIMAIVVAVLVLVLAGGGIVVTHKVAGPLFALRKFMDAVKAGSWDMVRPFRKGDEFPELGDTFKALAADIRGRHEAELKQIEEIRSSLAGGDAAGAARGLEALAESKRRYVKG